MIVDFRLLIEDLKNPNLKLDQAELKNVRELGSLPFNLT